MLHTSLCFRHRAKSQRLAAQKNLRELLIIPTCSFCFRLILNTHFKYFVRCHLVNGYVSTYGQFSPASPGKNHEAPQPAWICGRYSLFLHTRFCFRFIPALKVVSAVNKFIVTCLHTAKLSAPTSRINYIHLPV